MTAKVLIVDDDANARELMARVVVSVGAQVGVVDSGEKAIEVLGRHQVDLIVLDLIMPRGGGKTVLAFLETMSRPPQCIVVSALAEAWKSRRDESGTVRPVTILPKPVDIPLFTIAVRRALTGHIA